MSGVYKSIAAVQAAVSKLGLAKTEKNTQQSYMFRGIDGIYNLLAPLLSEHGLCILPNVLSREETVRQTAKGNLLYDVVVDVEYVLVAVEDGTTHTVRVQGEAMDMADKATNKAMSAAYKYMCFQVFCVPTEGDNDADKTTHEETVAQTKTASPKMTPGAWAEDAVKTINAFGQGGKAEEWQKKNQKTLDALKAQSPESHSKVIKALTDKAAEFTKEAAE